MLDAGANSKRYRSAPQSDGAPYDGGASSGEDAASSAHEECTTLTWKQLELMADAVFATKEYEVPDHEQRLRM